ncbi:inhibitor of nuclear factor kappa-B kinase-interacting protein isoform X2 [Tachyglossus aculeatus]|uniref:inhibitor of nuclear factor kappa-B kinase-interacting protein isoform X2 n=1 Tax=Tachyglossus aculeatus TaxID=9261 RepID=UPI0018F429CD|nr:inhibitor of nuclear factor kappa-B kinase-interacting protein isoform X2 [Tachyglossus aculeatus]
MSEAKPRKKGGPKRAPEAGPRPSESRRAPGAPGAQRGGTDPRADPRAALGLLSCGACLALALALAWFIFQQSEKFTSMDNKYQFMERSAKEFQDLKNKVSLLSDKCEMSDAKIEQLKDFQIVMQLERLQEDVYNMKTWSKEMAGKRDELSNNITALFQAVANIDQSTASTAKEVSLKITAVKTDIRRISGLVTDVTSLTDSVQELENKVEKSEKKTVEHIGDLLSSSIDRTANLRNSVSENAERIEMVKKTLIELKSDFNKHSDRLLNLESDRAKVMKTVTFAHDLKPKIYNLKKDFARLEPVINDLTSRIGRLVTDLLQRENEIALLNEKISNLTVVRTEIKNMKDEITKISGMS